MENKVTVLTNINEESHNALLLSIIIPVYNVQHFLEECLLSIGSNISKTDAQKVEVIVVNDGSTDSSADVISKLAAQFDFIKAIHKENGGLSDARNVGLLNAHGEYISFIDSDDLVDDFFLTNILKAIETHDFDILSFGLKKFYSPFSNSMKSNSGKTPIKKVELSFYNTQPLFAWNKIYRRKLFETETFIKGLFYEDVALVPLLLERASCLMHWEWECYFYRQRKGAITFNLDDKYLDLLIGVKHLFSVSQSDFILKIIINQFFTLCLISLRLPLAHSIRNLKKIISFYVANFPIDEMKPDKRKIHIPFFILKKTKLSSLFLFLLFKPAVITHLFLKHIRGGSSVQL